MKKQYFNLFIICFITKVFFSKQNLETFETQIKTNINSEGFYINDFKKYSEVEQWIPSLMSPTLLFVSTKDISQGYKIHDLHINLRFPFVLHNKEFVVDLYQNVPFLKFNYTGILMKISQYNKDTYYFGISPSTCEYPKLKEEYNTLIKLKNDYSIHKKIFSFDTWKINPQNESEIKSYFYLGDFNDIFNSNDKIVATCDSYHNNSHWGCSFKEMVFNNIKIQLKNETYIYKIYFASETHNLIFPTSFMEVLKELSNQDCDIDDNRYLACKNLFNDSNYVPLKLTEENEKFTITGQLDNIIRFNANEPKKKNISRIIFEEIDYIVLPLSVFKNFHLQFDAENNLISFYANESSILEVKKKEKDSSSSLGIVIAIIIILIILVLGFGGYWYFSKRKNIEKNINNFSKFEDEEDYQSINGKKVFLLKNIFT